MNLLDVDVDFIDDMQDVHDAVDTVTLDVNTDGPERR